MTVNLTPPKIAKEVAPIPFAGHVPLTRFEAEQIMTTMAGGNRPEFGAVLRYGDDGFFWDTGEIVKVKSQVGNSPSTTRVDVDAGWGSILVDNTNGPMDLYLPDVNKVRGKKFLFKWAAGFNLSVPLVHAREPGILIDYAPFWGLDQPLVAYVFQSDGEQWWVMT